MRKELDEALCAKYPLIFKYRHDNMHVTSMCWGFDCGDGWYNILDVLCGILTSEYRQAQSNYEFIKDKLGRGRWEGATKLVTQEQIDETEEKMDDEASKVPVAVQVKEKFGRLRFYVDNATDEHWNYISFAENMSYRTCENCGAVGRTYTDSSWLRTLCDIHAAMNGRTEHEENK